MQRDRYLNARHRGTVDKKELPGIYTKAENFANASLVEADTSQRDEENQLPRRAGIEQPAEGDTLNADLLELLNADSDCYKQNILSLRYLNASIEKEYMASMAKTNLEYSVIILAQCFGYYIANVLIILIKLRSGSELVKRNLAALMSLYAVSLTISVAAFVLARKY